MRRTILQILDPANHKSLGPKMKNNLVVKRCSVHRPVILINTALLHEVGR